MHASGPRVHRCAIIDFVRVRLFLLRLLSRCHWHRVVALERRRSQSGEGPSSLISWLQTNALIRHKEMLSIALPGCHSARVSELYRCSCSSAMRGQWRNTQIGLSEQGGCAKLQKEGVVWDQHGQIAQTPPPPRARLRCAAAVVIASMCTNCDCTLPHAGGLGNHIDLETCASRAKDAGVSWFGHGPSNGYNTCYAQYNGCYGSCPATSLDMACPGGWEVDSWNAYLIRPGRPEMTDCVFCVDSA